MFDTTPFCWKFSRVQKEEEIISELIKVVSKYNLGFYDVVTIFNNTLVKIQDLPIQYQSVSKSCTEK